MAEIGRLYMKIAGRDAGKICTVLDIFDNTYVLIDGQTRRRKCNILHLEPLEKTIEIAKNASHENVTEIFKTHGIEISQTKPKQAAKRPQRARKGNEQQKEEENAKSAVTITKPKNSKENSSRKKPTAKKALKKQE